MSANFENLPYNPEELPRELKKYYISMTDKELKQILKTLKLKSSEDLFAHIPQELFFKDTPNFPKSLDYNSLLDHIEKVSAKNNPKTSFIGDGLKSYKVQEISNFVSNIRGLTTAYTPYQPERGQGTLVSLWIYSSVISMLTGFEAVNASMYDRSTCLFEALNASLRIKRKSKTVIVLESIYPDDIEVLKTLNQETTMEILTVPVNPKTGLTDFQQVKDLAKQYESTLAGIAFPQVNSLGNLEDVHDLTDLCSEMKIQSIAIIDPMLLATKGLIPPVQFGSKSQGTDMFVAEGQHLALGPNFGGPGLGIFGIRYNSEHKSSIRSTPGRYVGKTTDIDQKEVYAMVLSTREQHIRREKATSNICSNQAFIATLAGASILERGEAGMTDACLKGRNNAIKMATELTNFAGVSLAFPETPFYNEFVLELPIKTSELIKKANAFDLHLGVDVSPRIKDSSGNHLLISFFDIHDDEDLKKLVSFFQEEFEESKNETILPEIPAHFKCSDVVNLPSFTIEELKKFYQELGDENVSPDENIYPLGSCTMKYNPYINDYAASLPSFTYIHPQAPLEDAQGSLEIMYEVQEMFKTITGLSGVTTQPLAGAQGELAGIKMFQAYHRNNGEEETRKIILIPHTAHGTNPATATMAGYETKKIAGKLFGIVNISASSDGEIDLDQVAELVDEHKERIAGIMVTNPNTSGIFETKFKEMADLIHSVGGLVYLDGANLNAIAGWIDLNKMGVDAVHTNLHKTWSISHGGGGPGSAIVAVSDKLVDYLPGFVAQKDEKTSLFDIVRPKKSIGHMHRHFGNFAHNIRCYTYLRALGWEGIRKMSATAVLSSRYLFEKLKDNFVTLPVEAEKVPRMHEFILSLSDDIFVSLGKLGLSKPQSIIKVGKLFLDFGIHSPTVAFPEVLGLMVEPTESYSKTELDRFVEILKCMSKIIKKNPEVLTTVPHFTPVGIVDEVGANKNVILKEKLKKFPEIQANKVSIEELQNLAVKDIYKKILEYHKKAKIIKND